MALASFEMCVAQREQHRAAKPESEASGKLMDLLIVERRANWSQWYLLARTLRQPVHVLVQLADESSEDLYARVESRLARPGSPMPRRIIVLGSNGQRQITF
jgi:hypothetical protein